MSGQTAPEQSRRFCLRMGVVTFFFVGLLPIMPGTYASFLTACAFLGLAQIGLAGTLAAVVLILVFSGLSLALCPWAEAAFGKKDPQPFVIDEVAGQFLALLVWRPPGVSPMWIAGAGFVLFRIFDIVKPFPAGRLERLPAGWGILLDDLAAAVYANLVLHAGILVLLA